MKIDGNGEQIANESSPDISLDKSASQNIFTIHEFPKDMNLQADLTYPYSTLKSSTQEERDIVPFNMKSLTTETLESFIIKRKPQVHFPKVLSPWTEENRKIVTKLVD